jgi:hypothetical protein
MFDDSLVGLKQRAASISPPDDAIEQVISGVKRRHRVRLALSTTCAGAVVTAAVVTGVLLSGGSATHRDDLALGRSANLPATATPSTEPRVAPVTPDALAQAGLKVRAPEAGDAAASPVSETDAIGIASRAGGTSSELPVANLYVATSTEYGIQEQLDGELPSHIEPALQERLVWVVTMPDRVANGGLGGPLGETPDTKKSIIHTWVVVDAVTGKILLTVAS